MEQRILGRTGRAVSEIGFGAWAIGGTWGEVSEDDAMAALGEALTRGITFFDTADVYGDGRSERLIARLRRENPDTEIVVATKAGRRLDPHVADGYTAANIEAFVDRSLRNLEVDTIDLLQLHCPPTEVYYRQDVFQGLDDLVRRGKLRNYGVSVEKVEEGLKAIEFPGVATVQIIFNMLRRRPAELFLEETRRRGVGVIARVPLASGLLTGKMTRQSEFAADDHRAFNRDGSAFDKGETFAGMPFEVGLDAMEALRPLIPEGVSPAQFALRWILMFDGISTVIPGGKSRGQVADNASAADLPPLDDATMEAVAGIYDTYARPHVHQGW